MYPPSMIFSAMAWASSLRVLPLHSILPITGMSSIPSSSTVRIWSACELAALETLAPVSEL